MNRQIEIDPRRCNGKPVVAGTRIPITVILDQLAESGSVEAVLGKYPRTHPRHDHGGTSLLSFGHRAYGTRTGRA